MISKTILEVVFATPVRKRFDYLLPAKISSNQIIGCRVLVPFGPRKQTGVVVDTKSQTTLADGKIKSIQSRLDDKPILIPELMRLAHWASHYYHHSLGEICFSMLATKYRQTTAFSIPSETIWFLARPKDEIQLKSSATKQQDCVAMLSKSPDGISDKNLKASGISSAVIKTLASNSVIQSEQRINDTPLTVEKIAAPQLTDEQQAAIDDIKLSDFQVYLLNGVTGSGKTEVYIRCIETILKQGKQALLLVPEIGLTPQTVRRFQQRLAFPVNLMHSGLNQTEQAECWSLCHLETPRLVIATRSGLFAPLANLGIIVVDEEHDTSYKQASGWLYSARDLAVMRASQANIPILLGSATPALETMQQANSGAYREILLTKRATNQPMPVVKILDIRKLPMQQGISKPLLDVMADRLAKGQQVMVFINRRGYAPVLMCHDCGWLAECPRCHSQYTLHRSSNVLRCHHCDAQRPIETTCPDCHSGNVTAVGTGTERLEEYLQQVFPNHPMVRIDRDSTRRKDAMQDYVHDIKAGKYQILIGTQMLAKGHHFPDLTLVVIVDMDGALFCSDFRAVERFGQLMTQVSGRAGRGKHPGQIVLQTRQPDHPHINTLINADYRTFTEHLLRERELTQWPPFSYLANLKAQAVKEPLPLKFLNEVKSAMQELAQTYSVSLLGPVPATQFKKAGKFRYQLLLQAEDRKQLHRLIDDMLEIIESKKLAKSVRWTLDVDPHEMV